MLHYRPHFVSPFRVSVCLHGSKLVFTCFDIYRHYTYHINIYTYILYSSIYIILTCMYLLVFYSICQNVENGLFRLYESFGRFFKLVS